MGPGCRSRSRRSAFHNNTEAGLVGITFDPEFEENGYVYVFYAFAQEGVIRNRVSRLTADGDVMTPGSEVVLFEMDPHGNSHVHNGGSLTFGADGKLYISSGDNGNSTNAPNMQTTLGKILRINPDGTIPADNPFYESLTGNNRAISALGVRNPFELSVQPGTGKMYLNDVGLTHWEEINEIQPGTDRLAESGRSPQLARPGRSRVRLLAQRRRRRDHGRNVLQSRDARSYCFPERVSRRLFFHRLRLALDVPVRSGNRCGIPLPRAHGRKSRRYRHRSRWNDVLLNLHHHHTGRIMKVEYTAGIAPPSIVDQSVDTLAAAGEAVTLFVEADGPAPFTYQWRRNGEPINGAMAASLVLESVQTSQSGEVYDVEVTNAFGTTPSSPIELTVIEGNRPAARIVFPEADATYAAGDTVDYLGVGFDWEDTWLPEHAFTWEVVFHHNTHFHPFLPPETGSSAGSFVVPSVGETAIDVWYPHPSEGR